MTQLLAAGGVRLTAMEIARFWSHINVGPKYQCWTWKGRGFAEYPYFRVWRDGKRLSIGAHVVALALKLGHDDFEVAEHSCDNKRCANPAHLSAGTHSSNLRASWQRRRFRSFRIPGQLAVGGGHAEPTRDDEIPF